MMWKMWEKLECYTIRKIEIKLGKWCHALVGKGIRVNV